MTTFTKTLAALALATAVATPAFANDQFAASVGIPSDVAQTLSLGEIAQIKAAIEADDNHIDSYDEYVRAYR